MRGLTVILPGILLVGLMLFSRWEEPEPLSPQETSGGSEKSLSTALHRGGPPVIWLSHDWIEVPPADPQPASAWRRAAFGLDRAIAQAECLDPNCRACLIDLVYGQEF